MKDHGLTYTNFKKFLIDGVNSFSPHDGFIKFPFNGITEYGFMYKGDYYSISEWLDDNLVTLDMINETNYDVMIFEILLTQAVDYI